MNYTLLPDKYEQGVLKQSVVRTSSYVYSVVDRTNDIFYNDFEIKFKLLGPLSINFGVSIPANTVIKARYTDFLKICSGEIGRVSNNKNEMGDFPMAITGNPELFTAVDYRKFRKFYGNTSGSLFYGYSKNNPNLYKITKRNYNQTVFISNNIIPLATVGILPSTAEGNVSFPPNNPMDNQIGYYNYNNGSAEMYPAGKFPQTVYIFDLFYQQNSTILPGSNNTLGNMAIDSITGVFPADARNFYSSSKYNTLDIIKAEDSDKIKPLSFKITNYVNMIRNLIVKYNNIINDYWYIKYNREKMVAICSAKTNGKYTSTEFLKYSNFLDKSVEKWNARLVYINEELYKIANGVVVMSQENINECLLMFKDAVAFSVNDDFLSQNSSFTMTDWYYANKMDANLHACAIHTYNTVSNDCLNNTIIMNNLKLLFNKETNPRLANLFVEYGSLLKPCDSLDNIIQNFINAFGTVDGGFFPNKDQPAWNETYVARLTYNPMIGKYITQLTDSSNSDIANNLTNYVKNVDTIRNYEDQVIDLLDKTGEIYDNKLLSHKILSNEMLLSTFTNSIDSGNIPLSSINSVPNLILASPEQITDFIATKKFGINTITNDFLLNNFIYSAFDKNLTLQRLKNPKDSSLLGIFTIELASKVYTKRVGLSFTSRNFMFDKIMNAFNPKFATPNFEGIVELSNNVTSFLKFDPILFKSSKKLRIVNEYIIKKDISTADKYYLTITSRNDVYCLDITTDIDKANTFDFTINECQPVYWDEQSTYSLANGDANKLNRQPNSIYDDGEGSSCDSLTGAYEKLGYYRKLKNFNFIADEFIRENNLVTASIQQPSEQIAQQTPLVSSDPHSSDPHSSGMTANFDSNKYTKGFSKKFGGYNAAKLVNGKMANKESFSGHVEDYPREIQPNFLSSTNEGENDNGATLNWIMNCTNGFIPPGEFSTLEKSKIIEQYELKKQLYGSYAALGNVDITEDKINKLDPNFAVYTPILGETYENRGKYLCGELWDFNNINSFKQRMETLSNGKEEIAKARNDFVATQTEILKQHADNIAKIKSDFNTELEKITAEAKAENVMREANINAQFNAGKITEEAKRKQLNDVVNSLQKQLNDKKAQLNDKLQELTNKNNELLTKYNAKITEFSDILKKIKAGNMELAKPELYSKIPTEDIPQLTIYESNNTDAPNVIKPLSVPNISSLNLPTVTISGFDNKSSSAEDELLIKYDLLASQTLEELKKLNAAVFTFTNSTNYYKYILIFIIIIIIAIIFTSSKNFQNIDEYIKSTTGTLYKTLYEPNISNITQLTNSLVTKT
jgi:hypothetical protein